MKKIVLLFTLVIGMILSVSTETSAQRHWHRNNQTVVTHATVTAPDDPLDFLFPGRNVHVDQTVYNNGGHYGNNTGWNYGQSNCGNNQAVYYAYKTQKVYKKTFVKRVVIKKR